MTTAPTPSEAERLAMVLRSACALSHPRFGTDARFVEMLASQAQAIEKELLRLQAENASMRTTLEYVERWANHHGAKPHITAEQALGCIQHHPDIHDITKGYADGKRPNTFDPYARIAELEARKPLPLSDEQIDAIGDKCGKPSATWHYEFARAIERRITGGSS